VDITPSEPTALFAPRIAAGSIKSPAGKRYGSTTVALSSNKGEKSMARSRVDEATYREFLSILEGLEKTGLKTTYRNILRRCQRSSETVAKCFAQYYAEPSESIIDRPLSPDVSRAINQEINRHVAFIGQEQQERIEQASQLVEQVLAENEELKRHLDDTERRLLELQAELSSLHSRHIDLTETSAEEKTRAADSIANLRHEVDELRRLINDLNLDKGRLAEAMKHEERLKVDLAEKLSKSERIMAETRQALQVKEVSEARLTAELRFATEHLALSQVKIAETEKVMDDLRCQLLESERRSAGFEALRGKIRQKIIGNNPLVPSKRNVD
jgi:DNA repair exonuclease SbcCD ATPase subunit